MALVEAVGILLVFFHAHIQAHGYSPEQSRQERRVVRATESIHTARITSSTRSTVGTPGEVVASNERILKLAVK